MTADRYTVVVIPVDRLAEAMQPGEAMPAAMLAEVAGGIYVVHDTHDTDKPVAIGRDEPTATLLAKLLNEHAALMTHRRQERP